MVKKLAQTPVNKALVKQPSYKLNGQDLKQKLTKSMLESTKVGSQVLNKILKHSQYQSVIPPQPTGITTGRSPAEAFPTGPIFAKTSDQIPLPDIQHAEGFQKILACSIYQTQYFYADIRLTP